MSLLGPKVSALLTTYNHERYVQQAIESVFAQETPFSVELIVCDDGSTDRTTTVVDEFVRRYPDRIRTLYRGENSEDSGAHSFLRGLEMCGGEYVALLDGDDYWTNPEKLRRQVEFLDARPFHWMCFHGCKIEYDGVDDASWEMRLGFPTESLTTEEILECCSCAADVTVQASTIVMRRELAGVLRGEPDMPTPRGWFIGLVASQLGPVGYVPDVSSVYRQHSGGAFSSMSPGARSAQCVRFCERVAPMLGEPHRELVERQVCLNSYAAAMGYEQSRDTANAKMFLSRALEGQRAWLEWQYTGYDLTADQVQRKLTRRLRLYDSPRFGLSLWFERVMNEARWQWLSARVRIRSHWRFERGKTVGSLGISPNPAAASGRGTASVVLSWTAAGTDIVEIHLGSPNGPLVSHTGSVGRIETPEWVADRMIFYLQSSFGGASLAFDNTLAVARASVRPPRRRLEGH